MFVQRLADSSKLHSEPMSYSVDKTVKHLQSVVSGYQANLEEMSEKKSEQQKDLEEMKIQLQKARAELNSSRLVLTNTLQTKVIKQQDCARRQVHKCQQNLRQLL